MNGNQNNNTNNGFGTESQTNQYNSINNNPVNDFINPSVNNSSNNYTNITSDKKKNKNIKKILLIIIILIVIGGVTFLGYKLFFKDEVDNEKFDINATSAFFIQNSDSRYALFNEDGKQLTEFIYNSVGSFTNGTAIVVSGGQVGIINTEGKLNVPLGKYKSITSEYGLYSAVEDTKKSYNKYLINGSGKVLYNLDNVNINTFINIDTLLLLEFEEKNKYTAINYAGKELVSFPKVAADDTKPSTNEKDGYISIFYNNKNWIFNVNNGKQLASFDSELHYCVNSVSEDGTIITLNSCVGWFQSQDKIYYKFIKDGKVYDKTNECDKIRENQGNLFCTKGSKEYLLDANLNIGIEIDGKAYSDTFNSYVMNSTTTSDTVDFYQNGKIVQSVSCRELIGRGYMKSDIYLLGTNYNRYCGTYSGQYEFYNSKGEKIINKTFDKATPFDSNDLARVSENEKTYHMIDKSGEQVGSNYSDIYLYNGFYIITNNDLKGIMNREGKEIIPTSYSKIDISTKNGKKIATLKTTDNKYIVYNLDENKELISVDEAPNMNHEHYMTASSNGKTQYYTYNGKMFYEK